MHRRILLLLIVSLCSLTLLFAQQQVLVFTKTAAFRHQSIPKGVATLKMLLAQESIGMQHSEDASLFTDQGLAQFGAIIFLNTSGDILDADQKTALQRFIRSGKGYVGIHAASDTEFEWPWYGQLVGGYFVRHPAVQEAKLEIRDTKHPATAELPKIWIHRDEWYDFRDIKPGMHILMNLDEESYQGGKMGKFHPIAWYQEFEGGRSFYTGLGHTEEAYDSVNFRKHIMGGIRYALGLLQ